MVPLCSNFVKPIPSLIDRNVKFWVDFPPTVDALANKFFRLFGGVNTLQIDTVGCFWIVLDPVENQQSLPFDIRPSVFFRHFVSFDQNIPVGFC